MTEVFTNNCNKFDIIIEVKTLCRKTKTTPWAELVENGFKLDEGIEWGKEDNIVKTSAEGCARMGLLAGYMDDKNKFMNPALIKGALPELSGNANGMGQIVLVGYKEGAQNPEPVLTIPFTFSQKPGGKITVSKSLDYYFQRSEEMKDLESRIPRSVNHTLPSGDVADVLANLKNEPLPEGSKLFGLEDYQRIHTKLEKFCLSHLCIIKLSFKHVLLLPNRLYRVTPDTWISSGVNYRTFMIMRVNDRGETVEQVMTIIVPEAKDAAFGKVTLQFPSSSQTFEISRVEMQPLMEALERHLDN